MSHHYDLIHQLRAQGLRLTPQRDMILLAMYDAGGHVSAEEVHQQVLAQNPHVDLSTVYRTLELLTQMGIVYRTDMGDGTSRYELADEEMHHHLVCRQCGRAIDLSHDVLKPLQERLLADYNFAADLKHMVFQGLCGNCRRGEAQCTSPMVFSASR